MRLWPQKTDMETSKELGDEKITDKFGALNMIPGSCHVLWREEISNFSNNTQDYALSGGGGAAEKQNSSTFGKEQYGAAVGICLQTAKCHKPMCSLNSTQRDHSPFYA